MGSKKESTFINMVITLLVIAVVSAGVLGGVYVLTKKPIAIAKKKKQENAIKMVLPEFDKLVSKKVPDAVGADSLLFTYAKKHGKKRIEQAIFEKDTLAIKKIKDFGAKRVEGMRLAQISAKRLENFINK